MGDAAAAAAPRPARADEGLDVAEADRMSVVVLVMSDGRDEYLGRAIASLESNLKGGPIVERVLADDSGDDAYRARLAAWYPQYRHIGEGPRRGFAGAYDYAWSWLAAESDADFVLGTEDDFLFNQPVDLDALAEVLWAYPHLAQMALRRQAWGAAEVSAGGFIQQQPDAYTDRSDEVLGAAWLEHTLWLTTNVSLYRRALCSVGWPQVVTTAVYGTSEAVQARRLQRDGLPWGIPGERVRFGFWGRREDPPLVHHIGEVRVGKGY